MLDPNGAGSLFCAPRHVGRSVSYPCDPPDVGPLIRINTTYLAMVVLLIVLFVWWVENWKRDKFKEWWS